MTSGLRSADQFWNYCLYLDSHFVCLYLPLWIFHSPNEHCGGSTSSTTCDLTYQMPDFNCKTVFYSDLSWVHRLSSFSTLVGRSAFQSEPSIYLVLLQMTKPCPTVLNILMCVLRSSVILTLCDPMDCIACQAPLSMGFSRQEYWSGCHALLQGIFPT